MTYLLMQMLICLLIAFILGLILGWLLCKICKGCKACCKPDGSCNTDKGSCDMPAVALAVDADITDLDTNVNLDGDGYVIETLEGVGPKTGDLFRGYGVATVGDYLRKLHSSDRRDKAADDLGILVKPLHEWASMSDLLRIDGIDHQYSELAYRAGIETVADLAASNGTSLAQKMETVNNAGKQLIAPTVPTASEVDGWVANARGMKAVVSV